MRLNVNLASQPYEDARQFAAQWTPILAGAALLAGVLVYVVVGGWMEARDVRRQLREVRAQMAELDRRHAQAVAILERPGNAEVRRRSEFLNAQIARKAFSWTQVFSDLETLMPNRLQVVSIRPEITADDRLQVQLSVAGPARDRAVELVRRLEQSERFRQPQVRSERARSERGDVQFEIVALYVPELQPPAAPAEAP
jgi:hypothetical protein